MTDEQLTPGIVHSVTPNAASGKPSAVSGGAGAGTEFTVARGGIEVPVQRAGVDRRAVLAFDLETGVRHWAEARGLQTFPAGALGEQLVVQNLVKDLCIGDRLQIGTAAFRVTAPVSWAELGARMGELDLPRLPQREAFQRAECPGVWLQVVSETGTLRAGDAVTKVAGQGERVPVTEAFHGWGWDTELRKRLTGTADAPVNQHQLGQWHAGLSQAVEATTARVRRLGYRPSVEARAQHTA